ncbi:LysE family translocator [Thalassotalea castellviae]|uniref:LysE family translocator n=1 Tax=Thalassotalea castellviae TaxID=3075612 RepID=A0ABU3A2A6_9GAMM|nr:LysE family translocator [Thalassotalea sp. W431]MDT0603076.1 LysE family translocator [Thalassotalea sp. W431]
MEFIALILFVFSTSGTPGPNNIMILTSGVNHGIRDSLPHVFGVNTGFLVMIICVGLGIMSLFQQWPLLHQLIQILGIGYLLYLAFKIATMPVNNELNSDKKPFSFLQAAAFQWVNPKAWIICVSAIVAFSTPNNNVIEQVLIISGFYFVFGLPCSFAWLMVGKWLQNILTHEVYVKRFNRIMAIILLTSLYPMLSETITAFTA